jgi:hypothetical protein
MHVVNDDEPERLPGLYRAWDLAQILGTEVSYRIEAAGQTREGTPLFAVYRYPPWTDGQ